jgi:hypothetical protein
MRSGTDMLQPLAACEGRAESCGPQPDAALAVCRPQPEDDPEECHPHPDEDPEAPRAGAGLFLLLDRSQHTIPQTLPRPQGSHCGSFRLLPALRVITAEVEHQAGRHRAVLVAV